MVSSFVGVHLDTIGYYEGWWRRLTIYGVVLGVRGWEKCLTGSDLADFLLVSYLIRSCMEGCYYGIVESKMRKKIEITLF